LSLCIIIPDFLLSAKNQYVNMIFKYFVISTSKSYSNWMQPWQSLVEKHCPIHCNINVGTKIYTISRPNCFHFWCPANIARYLDGEEIMIYILCACFLWCSLKTVSYVQIFYCLNKKSIFMFGLVVRKVISILQACSFVFELYL
jgi:hypothetical protein